MTNNKLVQLAANYRPPPRVRYNAEQFGFVVGFPDGEIVLTKPTAMAVLDAQVSRETLEPYLLHSLEDWPSFHLATPPLVWLELTRRCNLACPHCYIDAGKARSDEMGVDRWLKLIDELADMGVWAVAFTGGEPTLHPAFVEIVHHARRRNLLVGIATNGTLLTDHLLKRLPVQGVIISVSIDDIHVGNGPHAFSSSQGREAILRAQAHGFLTNIMTNTHSKNIDALEDLIGWAEEYGVSIRSVPMSPIGRGKDRPDLLSSKRDVEKLAQFWLRECELEHAYHREAGLCVGSIFNYGLSFAYMTRRCASGRYLCYVASDGTIFPCTMCAGEKIFASGSIRDHSFAEVWRSEWEIRKIKWDNFSDTCADCQINNDRYYCAGRCPALSHAKHNAFDHCGASEFEIQSMIARTALLEGTEIGKASNQPLVQEGDCK